MPGSLSSTISRVGSNSSPLHQWCFLTISSSVISFPFAFNLSPNQGLFFFLLNEIYLFIFTLQHCIGFAIHQHESTMGVHVFPILNPPPTARLIPSLWGHPSAPAPSTRSHASNLDWWFISYMILYMFQCHSSKSSHPFPLPQSPTDCSIHLCLFCCLAYRVIITIFLNSIHMH